MTTRVGIYGYGNLGRGIECAVNAADDWNWLLFSQDVILQL